MNAKDLKELAEALFQKKSGMDRLWQELAEQFYPERADFAYNRDLGDEFAAHLMTSYPVMIRRDLGDQIGTMLRRRDMPWFKMTVTDPEREDHDAKAWLQRASDIQRKAMYDPVATIGRATKEADHDYATFGQCAISSEIVWDNEEEGPHLLHRCWHLRDLAWQENRYGKVGNRFRKWKPTARDLYTLFQDKVHASVKKLATSPGAKPLTEVECFHMVVEADLYDMDKAKIKRRPWISVYYDCTNRHVIEEVPMWTPYYIIPRWQTVSGSQYAHSPATIVGLPDARLIQAMTRTMLEAGEKIVNPPIVAATEVIRSDFGLYPGGVTWVDRDYDERLGEALRPLTTDAKGMPLSLEMMQDARSLIAMCFYLNKLTLPQRTPEMTAYEVGQRVQQYIRDALPIFEPMESDYNGQLCELDFDLLWRGGAFGSPFDMPQSLQGAKVSFAFMSPLHDAIESQKAQKFLETAQMLAAAVQMDSQSAAIPDVSTALRDALSGLGVPQKWIRPEHIVLEMQRNEAQKQQAERMLDNIAVGAGAVKDLGAASQAAAPELVGA